MVVVSMDLLPPPLRPQAIPVSVLAPVHGEGGAVPSLKSREQLAGLPGVDPQLPSRSAVVQEAGAADHEVLDAVEVEIPGRGHIEAKVRVHAPIDLIDHLAIHAGVDPYESIDKGMQKREVRGAHRVVIVTIPVHITQATDAGSEMISVTARAEVLADYRPAET